MNQPQPFARGSSSAVATAGGPHGPLLQRGSPVPIIDHQRDGHSVHGDCTSGRQARRCCDHLPAGRQGAELLRVGRVAGGFSHRLTLPRNTGRGFGSGAFRKFGLRGRCSAHLARFHALSDRTFQSLRQGLPSHFKISVSCAANKAHEAPNAVHQSHEAGSTYDR